jgi:hypothetical protein
VTSPRTVGLAAGLVLGLAAALLTADVAPASASFRGHHDGHHHGHHHGPKVRAVWGPTSYVAGSAPLSVQGRVAGKRTVKLQVKLPGGWHTLVSSRSSRKGSFAISTPFDWYGTHRVRVTAPGRPALKRGRTVTVSPTYAARGNPADVRFLSYQGVRYSIDPCRTVRYTVNLDDVGPGALPLIQQALAQLSAATGIALQYAGTSHQIPFQGTETSLPAGQDLLIAFADEAEIPAFVTTPAIGFGGPVQLHAALDGTRHGVWEATQSAVVLDTDAWYSPTYDDSFDGTRPTWGETMLHELGHAFGLDHSPAPDEIMYSQAGDGVYPDGHFRGLYDAGDLAGLAADGLGQGCFHRVTRFREGAPSRIAAPRPQP